MLPINSEFNIEINKNYILEQSPGYKLKQVLMQHRKNMLMQKAVALGTVGRSKMNKSELVSALLEAICDVNELQSTLILLSEKEYSFCQQLMDVEFISTTSYIPFRLRFLIDRGLISATSHPDCYTYFIPLEVKEALIELDWNHILITRAYQLEILNYFKAAAQLYGAYKPELLIDIYNSHHEVKITLEELFDVYRFQSQREQFFYWYGDHFIISYFEEDNLFELDDLLVNIKEKPYYIPSKEIFSLYADSSYFEMTPQLFKLKHYVHKELKQDEDRADMVVDEIQLQCSMEEPLQYIMDQLPRMGVVLESFDQTQKLVSLIIDVHNNTRLWSNCGHTAVELRRLRNEIQPSDMRQRFSPVKIGRNDPCICGSGKKYKKCCLKGSLQ